VVCGDMFLMVDLSMSTDRPTVLFRVFRLYFSIVPPKWLMVENWGNHAIFVSFDQRNLAFCYTDPERWRGKSKTISMLPPNLRKMINLGLWSSLVRQCLVEIGGLLCILMLIPMAIPIDQITFGCFLVWFMMLGCEHLWFSWSFS